VEENFIFTSDVRLCLPRSLFLSGFPVKSLYVLLLFIISGVGLSPLGTAATSGLLYKPQMIDEGDCAATGGMKIGRGNRSTRLYVFLIHNYFSAHGNANSDIKFYFRKFL
jgi:hypothetical protein